MHSYLSFFICLVLSVQVLAAPAPQPVRKSRSFQIERVKRSDYVAHGPVAIRKAFRKFGITPVDFSNISLKDFQPFDHQTFRVKSNQANVAEPDQTGAVSATSVQNDVEFVSPVSVGGQTVTLDFDTGSADMWLFNTELPTSATAGRDVYDPKKSTTYKKIEGGSFKISYGDSSSASGGLAQDVVDIGGAVVKEQVFGLPTSVSSSFISDTNSNGLVGLGFSSINTFQPGPQKTFFDNIAPSLEEPLFTARLRSDGVGEYEFGKIDHAKYTGNLVNISVDASSGFWQFDAGYFAVGSDPLQKVQQVSQAIADTGTSLMLVSPDVVSAYYKQVRHAAYSSGVSGWVYPCSSKLPSLTVALGDKYQATIPGSLVNFAEVGRNTTTGETVCYGGIQSNQGSSLQIFGDVFLKALFVVFDRRGPSLGFATPV
ncbi:aspergillopepsin A-like aspartic endopeptidase [Penicillium diatomitis]|uniref:penicillopepsin n=1 Tax=Penicillium diatomitis TaxID=2819901 RepID=A0A9X0BY15_9EURO|nr:aspergillopepsin A-like aspartic endopeptidase [Penicillium diatomitis]KAJ5488742.1 aspergillopepsin A-like aspartic endopeptidase [Penicillium diatomitis]